MADSVEIVRSVYEAFAKGDVQTVLGLMSEKVEWNEAEHFTYWPGGPFWEEFPEEGSSLGPPYRHHSYRHSRSRPFLNPTTSSGEGAPTRLGRTSLPGHSRARTEATPLVTAFRHPGHPASRTSRTNCRPWPGGKNLTVRNR